MQLEHQPEKQRYVVQLDGAEAYISYTDTGGVRVLDYSFVPESMRGKKVGAELTRLTYELLLAEGVEAKATCGYLVALAKRNPAWRGFV